MNALRWHTCLQLLWTPHQYSPISRQSAQHVLSACRTHPKTIYIVLKPARNMPPTCLQGQHTVCVLRRPEAGTPWAPQLPLILQMSCAYVIVSFSGERTMAVMELLITTTAAALASTNSTARMKTRMLLRPVRCTA